MTQNKIEVVSQLDASTYISKNDVPNKSKKTEQIQPTWFQVYRFGLQNSILGVRDTLVLIFCNFGNDFFLSGTLKYPLLGIVEYTKRFNLYSKFITPLFLFHIGTITMVGVPYMIIIFPLQATNLSMIFGVFGVVIALVQSFMEINAISLLVSKCMYFDTYMEGVFESVLKANGHSDFIITYKKNYLVKHGRVPILELAGVEIPRDPKPLKRPNNNIFWNYMKKSLKKLVPINIAFVKFAWSKRNDKIYWMDKAFPEVGYFIFTIVKLLFIVVISNVPIIGPLTVVLLASSMRAKGNLKYYFKMTGYDHTMIRVLVHRHYGQFFGFGVVAGIIETVPFVSFLGAISNQIGGALWAIQLIELKKTRDSIVNENGEPINPIQP